MTLTLAQVFHLGNARSSRSVLSPAAAVSNRYALTALALSLLLQRAPSSSRLSPRRCRVVPLSAGRLAGRAGVFRGDGPRRPGAACMEVVMTRKPLVLCPVDFSESCCGALRYAAAIAEHFQSEL